MFKLLFDENIDWQVNPNAQCDSFSSNFDEDGLNDALEFKYTFFISGIIFIIQYIILVTLACKFGEKRDCLRLHDPRKIIDMQREFYRKSRKYWNLRMEHISIILMYSNFPIITMGIIQATTFDIGFSSVFIFSALSMFLDPSIYYMYNMNHKTSYPKKVPTHGADKLSDDDKPIYWDEEIPIKGEPNKYIEVKNMKARDIYQGSSSFIIVTAVFVAQVLLTVFYCAAVWEGGRPCFEETRQVFFYLMGNIVNSAYYLIMADTAIYVHEHDDHYYWRYTLRAVREKDIVVTKRGRKMRITSEFQWKTRHWMSVFVNGYLKLAVFSLMPIQVSQSPNSMDFVLNIVAAAFIVELDNYSMWGVDPAMIKFESRVKEYDTCPSPQQEECETNTVEQIKRIATEIVDEKTKEWRMLEEKLNSLILLMDSSPAFSVSAAIDGDNQSDEQIRAKDK